VRNYYLFIKKISFLCISPKGKRKDDDIGDLWRVHDKLYDLAPFMPQHPGGSVWLELTQGTVEATLAKHFVRDATTPRISPYVFKENGFFKTLKRKIGPVLKVDGSIL
jgi:hypothetical protein